MTLISYHNGSKYDHHFIITERLEEFKKQFTCLGENVEKYLIFIFSLEKEILTIDKNEEKNTKTVSYIIRFIDSARFIASSLLNQFSEEIHKIKCKFGLNDKKCENCEITVLFHGQILNIIYRMQIYML